MEHNHQRIYGLMAEFVEPDELVEAARRMRMAGYHHMDAYSPFPVEGLTNALGIRPTLLPLLIGLGGFSGAAAGFGMQWYASVIGYPLNVGGRPLNSWPAFIPITFEMAILAAAVTAVLGMLFLNGLPQPYHPVFNVPEFEMASRNRFFLVVEARDKLFDIQKTREQLEDLHPVKVSKVEP